MAIHILCGAGGKEYRNEQLARTQMSRMRRRVWIPFYNGMTFCFGGVAVLRGRLAGFFDEFGQYDDGLAADLALDMFTIVGDQRDIAHGRSLFGGKACALDF